MGEWGDRCGHKGNHGTMKRNCLKILALCSVLLTSVGCVDYDVEEILLMREDISLTLRGELHFKYDPMTCQAGYSPERYEFRVYDDVLGDWFVLKCSSDPAEKGKKVKASLEYTTSDSMMNLKDLDFEVRKTDSEGYVWMWNDSRKIGVVVKRL